MDKIINNGYRCSCNGMTEDAIVKVIEGNDVTLDIQLTKYNTEQEIWESYSLYGKEGVQVYLLTPNGTHINLVTDVQDNGTVKGRAESDMLELGIVYGIGVDWKDEGNDLSVKAKGMVKVIRYSEVNEEYDIEVTDSATYISIGQLPEDYVTPDDLDAVLENYATDEDLAGVVETIPTTQEIENQIDSALENYVTDSELSTTLDDYVTNSSLSTTLGDYVSDSELSTTLSDYVTATSLNTTLQDYVTNNDLSDYVTQSSLTTTLSDYVTDTELATSLNPYVTSTSLSTTLQDYVTVSDNENQNEAVSNSLVSLDNRVTTLEQNPSVPSNVVVMTDLDNYLEATAAALVEQEAQIDSLHSNFANYVTSEDNENQNEAISAVLVDHEDRLVTLNNNFSDYVTISDNEDQNEAISNSLVSLNSRVTTLEQNPGGGGTGDVLMTDLDNYLEATATALSEHEDRLDTVQGLLPQCVFSSDADHIDLVTQAEYDALVSGGTVDPDTLYYITDATSDYVTNSEMTSAINTAIAGVTIDETNLVHKTGTETITGTKTFTAECTWSNQSRFGHNLMANNNNLMNADIASGLLKTPMMVRPTALNLITGQIIAPNQRVDYDSGNSILNEVNTIKFQKVDSISNYSKPILSQLAKIDTNGIYEGSTLLADKYVQSTSIRNIVQISQSDYDNLVNSGTVDANTMYVII